MQPRTYSTILVLSIALLTASPGGAQHALSAARAGEFILGPFPLPQTVEGVPIALRASVFVTLEMNEIELRIGARVVGDLSDLQRKIQQVAKHLELPSDRCESKDMDTLKYALTTRDEVLSVRDAQAMLDFGGKVEACYWFMNPICTKFDPWPKIYACPNKLKLSDSFRAHAPFELIAKNQTVALTPHKPRIDLGSDLATVATKLLKKLGVDIERELQRLFEQAIDPVRLKNALPAGLLQLNPVFSGARFFDNSGSLAAEIEMEVHLDRQALLNGEIRSAGGAPAG